MRDYLVNEGQVPLDSCLILLPLQPELLAELLLGLFDVSVGQFPLLSLWGIKHNMEITIRPGKQETELKENPLKEVLTSPTPASRNTQPPKWKRREVSPGPLQTKQFPDSVKPRDSPDHVLHSPKNHT